MIKISIIVPVFNNEIFLEECIESIINQDYQNIELVLINDGSTDSSGYICDMYQKEDNRIKVYHQENAGVSAARNLGLIKITGDYVCFVDSDDWIKQGMFSFFANNLKDKIELIYFEPDYSDIETKTYYRTKEEVRNKFLPNFIGNTKGKHPKIASVWSLAISKKLLENMSFKATSIAEDKIFFIELLLKSNNVKSIKSFYNYRKNLNSALNTYNKNYVTDLTFSNNEVETALNKYDLYTNKLANYHKNTVVVYFMGVIKNELRNKNFSRELFYENINKYYDLNAIDMIFTWKKTLRFSIRNFKWILIKIKEYNLVIKLLNQ